MKLTKPLFSLIICFSLTLLAKAQDQSDADSTGLPGDNFSLQGALEMFKKSSSPEEFEKLINTQDNGVNNLDLNGDGDIDYIRVIDKSEKDAHAFVLQVPVSETENQDIAVIELEKTGDTTAVLQIIGDEDIFGEETIVEPDGGGDDAFIDINNSSIAHGPDAAGYVQSDARIAINVWFWPAVRFVYRPAYVVWYSPWRWHHYPGWWRPWRPFAWHIYRPMRVRYYRPFVVVHTHRLAYAHRLYTPVRVSSVTVRTRNQASINNYRVTRTRTRVIGPRGNRVTHQTTTIRGRGGNTHARSTRTTVRKRR